MAGVIARAVREGRPLTVVIATNGDAWGSREDGLRRGAESVAGLELLGVPREHVVFLGYPDGSLGRLPRFRAGETYALDGEYRFLRTGRHARRTRRNFARDVSDLVAAAEVVYTHVPFDGHGGPRRRRRAGARGGAPGHRGARHADAPARRGRVLELSASRWPGPAGDPAARFRPGEELEPPPSPACAEHPAERTWGPLGPPQVRIAVPARCGRTDEAANLKWRAIACHESQVGLGPVSAGYMRAFVRRQEFFWRLTP